MFYLRIFFFGLIGFVPAPEEGKMLAVLIDARDGGISSDSVPIGSHGPCIQWRNFSGVCEDQGWHVRRERFEIFWLDDMNVVKEPEERLTAAPRQGSRPVPISESDAEAFSWTVNMGQLYDSPQIDPSVLLSVEPSRYVAGQILLDQGRLQTCRLIDNDREDGEYPVFRFRPLTSRDYRRGQRQALADIVSLVVAAPEGATKVKFVAKGFQDEGVITERSVVLPYVNCGAVNCVDVFVWNMPIKTRREWRVARHLELQYDILDSPPGRKIRPVAERSFYRGSPYRPKCAWPSDAPMGVEFMKEYQGDLDGLLASLMVHIDNRPICPMVQYP